MFLISPGREAEQDTVVAKPPGAAGMGPIGKIYGSIGIYAAVFNFRRVDCELHVRVGIRS